MAFREYQDQKTTGQLENYSPPVDTLANKKIALLAQAKIEKLKNIRPEPEAPNPFLDGSYKTDSQGVDGYFGNVIDGAQSSAMQGIANWDSMIANTKTRLSNATNGFISPGEQNAELAKYQDREYANKQTGYDSAAYDKTMEGLEGNVGSMMQNFGQGNYGQAIGDLGTALGTAAVNTPEILAGSTESFMNFAAGAAAASATGAAIGSVVPGVGTAIGAGVGLVGSVGKAVYSAINSLSKVAPKTTAILNKAVEVAPKVMAGNIADGAAVSNKSAEEYFKATGEHKPALEVVSDIAVNTLLSALGRDNITSGISKNVIGEAKDTLTGMLSLVAPDSKGYKLVLDTLSRNVKEISKSSGREFAQEYLQTWAEILQGTNKGFNEVISDKENQVKAMTGGVIGLGVGGTMASIVPAATLPVKLGAAATKGITSSIADKVTDTTSAASYRLLPESDRQAIADKYNTENEIHTSFKDNLEAQTNMLESIRTKADLDEFIKNPENTMSDGKIFTAMSSINKDIEKFIDTETGIEKPISDKQAVAIARKAMSANNKAITDSKVLLESARAGDATYRLYKNVEAGTKKVAKVALDKLDVDVDAIVKDTIEVAQKTYKATKDFGGKVIDEVVDLDTSAARGYLEYVRDGRAKDSIKDSDISKQLKSTVNKISDGDLDKLITIAKNDPVVKEALVIAKKARDSARRELGIISDKIIQTIPENSVLNTLKSNVSLSKNSAISLYHEMQGLAGKKIINQSFKDKLETGLQVLKDSGHITAIQAKNITNNIRRGYVAAPKVDVSNIKKAAKDIVKTVKNKSKAYYKVLKPKVEDFVNEMNRQVKDQGVDLKNLSNTVKSGASLTTAETKYMTNRVADQLVRLEGDVEKLYEINKIFYDNNKQLVDALIDSKVDKPIDETTENILTEEDIAEVVNSKEKDIKQSSPKQKEDTILDTEDKVSQVYESSKVEEEAELSPEILAMFNDVAKTICK